MCADTVSGPLLLQKSLDRPGHRKLRVARRPVRSAAPLTSRTGDRNSTTRPRFFFAESLSCDRAHAQFRSPRFIDQCRIGDGTRGRVCGTHSSKTATSGAANRSNGASEIESTKGASPLSEVEGWGFSRERRGLPASGRLIRRRVNG